MFIFFRVVMDDSEYFDFYQYLLNKESVPDHHYLNKQSISDEMRATTIDWIISLGCEFRTINLVVHITVLLLDKFLSISVIQAKNLQLVGAACFFIACKYEEVYPPKIRDIVYTLDGAGTKSDLVDMEALIMKTVDYQLGAPTASVFLYNLVNMLPKDLFHNSFNLASYCIELSLLTTATLKFSYSIVAASSLTLARIMLEIDDPWPKKMVKFSNLDFYEMEECILFLSSLLSEARDYPHTKATRDKYNHYKYNSISRLKLPENFQR